MAGLAWCLLSAGAGSAAEAELIGEQTPWRAWLVVGATVGREAGTLRMMDERGRTKPLFDPADAELVAARFSRLPDANWMSGGYDAACWARYLPCDLRDFLGDYGVPRAQAGRAWPALLCLRTRFGIADPARAGELKATATFLGGAVVYVNGREIARAFLPPGKLRLLTPAEDYPIEAYTGPDGTTALPDITGRNKRDEERAEPEPELLPRYQRRIRTITVSVPPAALVKGANVLAVEIHQSPIAGPLGKTGWAHLGIHGVGLTSDRGEGVVAWAGAAKGTRLWSANGEDQVADTPSEKSVVRRPDGRPVLWMHGKAYRGIACGNPFDPVLPVRLAGPRNGVCSGQVVVTDPAGVRGLKASLGPLKGGPGEIPPGAVGIRYAAQQEGMHFCDALLPAPPGQARTVPVWVIVQVPKSQPPGWYAAALNIQANGKTFSAPVQVLVTSLTLPDARDFTSDIGAATSPDTIALHYKVQPWSAEHFRLMEPSMRMLGQLGNDVLQVPVILGGMVPAARDWFTKGSGAVRWQPLVRWVRTPDGLRPDFSLLERYLDAYLKHCAPPKALCLYVWDSGCSKEVSDAYEGRRIATKSVDPKTPLLVQEWDPKTGRTSEAAAPNFGDEGAEAFWKPLFDGVRAIVTRRGWSERIIMAGLGGDLRPGQRSGELIRRWAPYVRWQILSHFSGDPPAKDGKLIATGGLEVGVKEYPWRAFMLPFSAAKFETELSEKPDFIDLPTARWHWQDDSPPYLFRTLPMIWGTLGHLGLDFWLKGRDVPRNSSFFTSSDSLTVPGGDGAEPTVRFQMLREGVQDMEIRWTIVRACRAGHKDRQAVYDLLDDLPRRMRWGIPYLSQCELSYDWRSYAAAVQEAAADLAGAKSPARWSQPPK